MFNVHVHFSTLNIAVPNFQFQMKVCESAGRWTCWVMVPLPGAGENYAMYCLDVTVLHFYTRAQYDPHFIKILTNLNCFATKWLH